VPDSLVVPHMARSRRPDDDPPDEWDDPDDLPEGVYHDDEYATVPCPYCREPVPEEAQFCGKCENYISKEDAPHRKPAWIWVCLFLVLAATRMTMF
jgi:predicted nucleic acid-binding Zn ribbon protein